jgi:glycosyltransferase involved in cell wall biosynthesis
MQVTSLYICPWSLEDPLCQSQTLPYLRGLNKAEGYKFALMTFENPAYAVTEERAKQIKTRLEEDGIYWYPTSYHPGMSIFTKAYDNFTAIFLGLKICRKHKPRIIHSRSSLPTIMAMSLAKLCGLKFLYDADSMLSEEYADNGHWSRDSMGYKMMSKSERLARRFATRIIVLSNVIKQDFENVYNVKVPVDVIPCCVDTQIFRPNLNARKQRREELGLTNEKLLVYVGKVGGRYLINEIFDFFKAAQSVESSFRLLIISQEPAETFNRLVHLKGINRDSFSVRSVHPSIVSEYLSASDVGLAFIRNVNSERSSSPIKIAEYLATGLPVVLTEGIGDCTNLIKEKKVGAIIKQMKEENYLIAINQVLEILREDISDASAHQRQVAEEKFSLEKVGIVSYSRIYQKLLTS